jgi:hypothetical protein
MLMLFGFLAGRQGYNPFSETSIISSRSSLTWNIFQTMSQFYRFHTDEESSHLANFSWMNYDRLEKSERNEPFLSMSFGTVGF